MIDKYTNNENKISIEVKNVSKSFDIGDREITILRSNSLLIKKGTFNIIFGPSGSGKSTLLNTIVGLERPDSGSVIIDGEDIYQNLDDDERAIFRKNNIGIITQQQNWIKSLNIIENVSFPLVLQGTLTHERMNRAHESLNLVGLTHRLDFVPNQLSGGEQQKVGLARAIVANPQILVTDEPTGNLDFRSGINVINILRELVNQGKTVIMVTHDVSYIEYADQVIHIFDGEIIEVFDMHSNNLEDVKTKLTRKISDLVELSEKINIEKTLKKDEVSKNQRRIDLILNLIKKYCKISWKLFLRILISPLVTIKYIFILILYLFDLFSEGIIYFKFIPENIRYKLSVIFTRISLRIEKIIERNNIGRIHSFDLVGISIKNMFMKKSRTIITVGGIAIAISVIVLLVSVGYGLEKLVITRVAKLNERRQLEATPAIAGNIIINDRVLEDINRIEHVKKTIPIANIAGRINYKNSNSDIVVHGITSDYLTESSLLPFRGEFFSDNNSADKESVVVNKAFLDLLSINIDDAIGQNVSVSFIITKELIPSDKNEIISDQQMYKIKGVIDEMDTPIMYVPIRDVIKMGIDKYSQVKILVDTEKNLNSVRSKIEAFGFTTSSVIDTVNQISSMFSVVRRVLFFIGAIALFIASLGMVNTLTISLLERTKEVSLMKTLGMRSIEVEELFLTESLLMGITGGILGILIGFFAGQFISLLISLYAISQGYSGLSISYIPPMLIINIIGISGILGVITGYYPSQRSKVISPLDAMRYE